MRLKVKAVLEKDPRRFLRSTLKAYFLRLFPGCKISWPTDEHFYVPGANVSCDLGSFIALMRKDNKEFYPSNLEDLSGAILYIREQAYRNPKRNLTPEIVEKLISAGWKQEESGKLSLDATKLVKAYVANTKQQLVKNLMTAMDKLNDDRWDDVGKVLGIPVRSGIHPLHPDQLKKALLALSEETLKKGLKEATE
jgi:hypothetical protein